MLDGTSDSIRLSFPATPDFARIGRVGIAGLALRLGVDVQRVEHLRLAVDLCVQLLEGEGQISIEARWDPGHLEIELTRPGFRLDDLAFAACSNQLADLVDEVSARPEGITFTLSSAPPRDKVPESA